MRRQAVASLRAHGSSPPTVSKVDLAKVRLLAQHLEPISIRDSDEVDGRRTWIGAEIISRHHPVTIVWTEALYYV